jgi:hypothetical protein
MPLPPQPEELRVSLDGEVSLNISFADTGFWIELDLVDTNVMVEFSISDPDACRKLAETFSLAAEWMDQ